MKERLLREIAEEYLVPLFSGSRLELDSAPSSSRHDTVALRDPCCIQFKVDKEDSYWLQLTRAQPFSDAGGSVVPELAVVRSFVEVLLPMQSVLTRQLRRDLLSTFQRRVVAKAVAVPTCVDAVLEGIDILSQWGNRLYEGAPIAAAIGFRNTAAADPTLDSRSMVNSDFAAVLSNGHDTILEFNHNGRLLSHHAIAASAELPSYCPLRQAPLAGWTTKSESRVALALNRLGEILVLRDHQLLFARRSGHWSFLTHDPILVQMGTPHDNEIRKAVYETCLDASFARTGACLGVVSGSYVAEWRSLVDQDDRLENLTSPKTVAIAKMIKERKFHELDRRLRQELAAIDGAMILSNSGQLLAAGAILKIAGGSTGGGRLAAAKALSKVGLGIKVSQDGGISGYRLGKPIPAFRVM